MKFGPGNAYSAAAIEVLVSTMRTRVNVESVIVLAVWVRTKHERQRQDLGTIDTRTQRQRRLRSQRTAHLTLEGTGASVKRTGVGGGGGRRSEATRSAAEPSDARRRGRVQAAQAWTRPHGSEKRDDRERRGEGEERKGGEGEIQEKTNRGVGWAHLTSGPGCVLCAWPVRKEGDCGWLRSRR